MCVSRMLAGGRLYQGLLVDLSGRLGGLEALSAELRDLVTHINQVTHTHLPRACTSCCLQLKPFIVERVHCLTTL